MERPDHPHKAAVHLMKALRCCRECYDVSEADYYEIKQLQIEQQSLARQFQAIEPVSQEKTELIAEIHELEYLVAKMKQENHQAYQAGIDQVQKLRNEKQEKEKNRIFMMEKELKTERQRFHSMNQELEKLMEQVRHLHRVNEELVHKFCDY